jgi:hypothetical protein
MSSRPLLASLLFAASAALAVAQAPRPSLLETFVLRGGFSSDEAVGSGSVSVAHYELAVGGRFAAGPSGFGLLGLNYRTYQIDATGSVPVPQSLNEISATLGLQRRLSPTWSVLAVLKPGLYGDFEQINGDSFNAPLLALANYSVRPGLTWTFGLNVSAIGENPVLPAIGVSWRFAPELTFNLAYPRTDVTWQVSQALATSIGIRFEGGSYRVTDTLGVPQAGVRRLANTYVGLTEIRVGAGLRYNFNRSLRLDVEAGVMTDRKFDYYDRDYTLNGDAGTFASVSLNNLF